MKHSWLLSLGAGEYSTRKPTSSTRLGRPYEAIETSELSLEVLAPRIMSLRHRGEQLEAARDDAETRLEQRRVILPETEERVEYVAGLPGLLKDGTIPERKALIHHFVEGIEVEGAEATLTYTVPVPSDGVTSETASVLDFVKSSPPSWTVAPAIAAGLRSVSQTQRHLEDGSVYRQVWWAVRDSNPGHPD